MASLQHTDESRPAAQVHPLPTPRLAQRTRQQPPHALRNGMHAALEIAVRVQEGVAFLA